MSGFFNNLSKKIYSSGNNFAKKVQSGFLTGTSKIRSVLHDVKGFVDKVNEVAPFASQIVDDVTNLIPGAQPIKQGLKYGLSAFNTISSFAGVADDKLNKASSFARNPNVRRFNRIFNS